ncbi:E1-E2 ATPase-domain-containing protein, partial [Coemansia mojavensis]
MEENRHLQYLSELQRTIREWRPWLCTLAEVADKLGVDPSRGLEHLEARNRLIHFGPNVPVELSQRLDLSQTLVKHAMSPSTLLLVAICILYFVWGDIGDAVAVMLVAAFILLFRVYAEWRADQALVALRNSVPANTTVLRNGREGIVASNELVLGDVITLSRGQLVPADAVVVVCHGLSTDESLLTGDSGATREHYPLPDDIRMRVSKSTKSLVYAGTRVASGRAVCIVVATSRFTEVGSGVVTAMHSSQQISTPLQSRLQQLTEQLSIAGVALCIAVGIIGLLRGMDWLNVVLLTASLIVATIPAAMPLAAKMFLAICSRKLSRHGLLVRKLHAADALSSVSAIVTDKTGTLTRNQLVVSSILTITTADGDGEGLSVDVVTPESALATERSAALKITQAVTAICQRLSTPAGELVFDPTLRISALTRTTAEAPRAYSPRMQPETAASAKGPSSTLAEDIPTRKHWTVVKGAAEVLLPLCSRVWRAKSADLQLQDRDIDNGSVEGLIAKGRRLPLLPSDMVFVGAFAFFDPPQQDARPVVQECQEAGIRVIVATGDHPSTALSVASAVGVVESHMSQPAGYGAIDSAIANHSFNQIIDESNVFARMTPVQKLRLVNALQTRGDMVAFIGDGINDAPPLTRADIGICMSGHPSTADVAMDAAGLVVLSGNFSEVVCSLREGRLLKANINKAMTLYIASKLALVLLFLFMVAVENISPLLPVQLLLIVLFTD